MFRFWRSEEGNVAIIFTLAIIPVIGMIGAGVDYSRKAQTLSQMQIAVDATALALSRMPNTTPAGELQIKADQYFKANFNGAGTSTIAVSVTPGKGTLSVNAAGTVPTKVMLTSVSEMPVSVSATVKWGTSKLEVALALDNTGSMSSNNKMTKLKQATNNLLTTLQAAAKTEGDVKVSIIPFGTTVRVGTTYKDEPWMRYDTTETKSTTKANWTGCVLDRGQSYDVNDSPPVSGTADSLFTAATSGQCGSLAEMIPLTYDWTALTNRVAAMTPSGNTNVTIGLEWAWHALSTTTPLTQGGTSTVDVPIEKVIVLLTDGDNTEHRFCKNAPTWPGTNCSQSAIDARTALACANVKAAGIKLYTVRVINGNANLLRTCASEPSSQHYFEVTNAADLIAVFDTIAGNLANLHLSK